MKSTCKPFLVIMLVIATTLHAFSMAQAGFRRGGAKDTFFDIIACKDGVSVDVGINAQLSIPPIASIKAARLVSGNTVIFDGKPITWILDRGPGVVIDTEFGETVTQTFTGSKVIKWNDGIQLRPGNRILLEGVEIMGREVNRFVPDTAGTFEAIIGNCETTDPPNDNISRVFKFDRYEDDETMIPANSVAIESVITVTPETSSFPPGQVIVDINVGMYLEAHVSEVFLISPSGSKARLFQNLDSDSFGTRLSHLGDHGLTSDLMPDFILDDDSEFDFGKSSSPYNTNAIHPDQPLSIFNGEDPHGNWTLEIDNTSQFIGSLKGWDIEIEVANSINKTVSIEQTCFVQDGLNLRTGPGINYIPPIKILPKNSEVQMIARSADNKWLQVEVIPDSTVGWVYAEYVDCNTSFQYGVSPTKIYINTQDAEIDESTPNQVAQSPSTCHVDGNEKNDNSSKDQNALLRWDLTAIPANSRVFSATLDLNIVNPTQGPYSLYALRRAWEESAVTWNQAKAGVAWQLPGAQGSRDRNSIPVAMLTTVNTGLHKIILNAAGIALVQEWVTRPDLNFGLVLAGSTTMDGLDFDCKEASVLANRPRLNVHYH